MTTEEGRDDEQRQKIKLAFEQMCQEWQRCYNPPVNIYLSHDFGKFETIVRMTT